VQNGHDPYFRGWGQFSGVNLFSVFFRALALQTSWMPLQQFMEKSTSTQIRWNP